MTTTNTSCRAAGNVVATSGGKVHAPHPTTADPWPLCRTGGQNQRGTRYTTTTQPVTCAVCGIDPERS